MKTNELYELKDRKMVKNQKLVPQIILGSFQVKKNQIMKSVVETAIREKCFGFDTAPSYGNESLLAAALNDQIQSGNISRSELFVTTKIDGWQMCESDGNIERYILNALALMGFDYFDSVLVHWPFEKYLKNTWFSLEKLRDEKLIRHIGLCNVNIRVLDKLVACLNILPEIIQNEIHPLRTCIEEVEYFQGKNIKIQAYSPIGRMIEPIKTSTVLAEIAQKHEKNIPQIILRWHIERGITPVFTSTKPTRIAENIDIFNFKLSVKDVNEINLLNKDYKIFPESFGCPGF